MPDFAKTMKSIETQTSTLDTHSIGVDTSDLARPLDLSIEFQYCIGHEPELHPDDLPHYEEKDPRTYADASTSTTLHLPTIIDRGTDVLHLEQEMATEPSTSIEEEASKNCQDLGTQTDKDWLDAEVKAKIKADKEKRKSVDAITETEEEEAGEFIMITCAKCDQTTISSASEHYEKIPVSFIECFMDI